MKKTVVAVTLALLAGLVSADASASTPTDGKHHHYTYPADIREARKACFKVEREKRNIPGSHEAYVAWWNANEGTAAQLDWSAAYDACKDRNELPGGQWNWDAMVYLGYY